MILYKDVEVKKHSLIFFKSVITFVISDHKEINFEMKKDLGSDNNKLIKLYIHSFFLHDRWNVKTIYKDGIKLYEQKRIC